MVSDTIWGPLGHFNVLQQEWADDVWSIEGVLTDESDDVWSIEGVLTDESDMKTYSGIKTTREQAVEHARVLAGIAPFGPEEEIRPVSTDRPGLVAHSRNLS